MIGGKEIEQTDGAKIDGHWPVAYLRLCAVDVLHWCDAGRSGRHGGGAAGSPGAVDAVHKRDCDILKIGRLSEDSLPVLLSVVVSMAWILFVNIVSRPNKLI